MEKFADELIIDCGGVGFKLNVPLSQMAYIANAGEICTVYTFLNVKEDGMDLYGFADKQSQRTFKIITNVSGVGPKVGLSILSTLTPDKISLAISAQDYKAFTACSGVGPKLAQRIVLELKDKLGLSLGSTTGIELGGVTTAATTQGTAAAQAVAALVSLGYSQTDAAVTISKLDGTLPVEELIKQGLRTISKSR